MPPKGIQNVLDKFKADFSKNTKVLADAARARDEKIKKKKKPTAQARKKSTTKASSGTSGTRKEQEQWMNDARGAEEIPLGLRQKMVIDFLRAREAPASWEDVLNGSGRNIEAEADLKNALEAHPKVSIDSAGMYSYVPDANIKNKRQLLDYVRASPAPVAVHDLMDSYKGVTADIEALKAEGLLVGLFSYRPELNCEVLYSIDGKLKLTELQADADVTALWTYFSVPETDDSLDDALRKAGILPAPRKEKPKKLVSEKKKKKRKQSKLRAVTNVHLLHLFVGSEAVQSIDE